ncbi:MAG: S41 family peptidase [Mollicutes bacterium]|nr:S41 family peptidase [Mollicutes bacterium]
MNIKRKIFTLYEMIAFMLLTAVISSLTCGFIMFKAYENKKPIKDYSSLTENEHLLELINNYNQINDKFYQKIDEGKLVDHAIKGMLDYLGEPYTEYIEEDRTNGFNEQLQGTYEGIGVEMTVNPVTKQIYVKRVFPDSPAEEAGVLVGDIFLKVNGEDVKDEDLQAISEKIKYGDSPTSVILFLRGEEEIELSLTRKKVEIISAYGRVIEYKRKKVGYLHITSFAALTNEQVRKALKEFKHDGIKEVIIDVRDNTGGYLDAVVKIAEQFIEKGKRILYLEAKDAKNAIIDSTDEKSDLKIVVLVNGASASASEILAAALRETYGAKLVGNKTFGKGKFQETGQLSTGASIKFTAGTWYTPNDVNIDGVGLTPDYEVVLDEKYYLERIDANDNQLQKALEVVTK